MNHVVKYDTSNVKFMFISGRYIEQNPFQMEEKNSHTCHKFSKIFVTYLVLGMFIYIEQTLFLNPYRGIKVRSAHWFCL